MDYTDSCKNLVWSHNERAPDSQALLWEDHAEGAC